MTLSDVSMSPDTSMSPLELIRSAFLQIAGEKRTGAQLHALIYSAAPGFDVRAAAGVPVGPGALTRFLNTNFGDIVHPVGKHGGDTLYLIGDSGSASDFVPRPNGASGTTNIWAAFASPGLRQQLVFDRATGRSFVQPQGAALSDGQLPIQPVTLEEFREIAEGFLKTAPPDLREELQGILAQPEFVYQNWITTLRDKYPSHHHRWGLYRVQSIIELFRRRLIDAGIPQDQLEATLTELVEAQSATYKDRLFARTRAGFYGSSPNSEVPQGRITPRISQFDSTRSQASLDPRLLAIMAINSMSATEIRQLTIPLGAIIDAGLLSRK